jgi:hypothetical protein
VPSFDLDANFENSFERILWSIPYPVSSYLLDNCELFVNDVVLFDVDPEDVV